MKYPQRGLWWRQLFRANNLGRASAIAVGCLAQAASVGILPKVALAELVIDSDSLAASSLVAQLPDPSRTTPDLIAIACFSQVPRRLRYPRPKLSRRFRLRSFLLSRQLLLNRRCRFQLKRLKSLAARFYSLKIGTQLFSRCRGDR